MPKELFNQPTIESPDQPDDDLRISFGKPGVPGGFNVLWSYFKQLIQGALNFIAFIPQDPAPIEAEAVMYYDDITKAYSGFTHIAGVPPYRFGRTLRSRVLNNTVSIIPKGDICKIVDLVGILPIVEPSRANELKDVQTSIGMAMKDIPASGGEGLLAVFDTLIGVDTSGMTINDLIYLDPDNAGKFVNVRPTAPDYALPVGFVAIVDAVNGIVGVRFGGFDGSDTSVNGEGNINGIVTQTPDVAFSVSGGIIYADITNEVFPIKNLPFLIAGTRYYLDTTTGAGPGGAARVVVPPGLSATELQESFLYVYLNVGVPTLAIATSEPAIAFAPIGDVIVFDAVRTLADGRPFGYRRSNNAIDLLNGVNDGGLGLMTDLLAAFREKLGSNWIIGQDGTPTVDNSNIKVALTAGVGRQFRKSNLPLFDGNSYLIYNTIANLVTYAVSTNLTDITQDAGGASLLNNGTYYTIRLFYQLNSNGVGNSVIATRPLGSYSSAAEAQSDPLNFTVAVQDIKIEEIVYPLYDIIIGRTGASGVNIALIELRNLRTKLATGRGGGGAQGTSTDDKIRISAADTTNDYLNPKITIIGALKTIVNPAGNEVLDFKVNTLYEPDGSAGVVYTDNNGDLGINTAAPVTKLHVVGTALASAGSNAADIVTIENDGSTNLNLIANVTGLTGILFSDTTRARGYMRYDHSTEKIEIQTAGSQHTTIDTNGVTSVDFILSSDKRLKKEINYKNVPSIDGLKPVTYKINGHFRCGFIAQDALLTHKVLVGGTGKEIKGKIEYHTFAESSIIAMLVKEVQKLKAKQNGTR